MKIIIMGTGPFAVPTCKRLLAEGHEIPLVVTRPVSDPKAKKLPPRPVYEWAQQHDLPIFEPPSVNAEDAVRKLEAHAADLFFVCDYGQILSDDCLAAARLGGINLHGSILPRHRGTAPVQWTLLRGDAEAGITVIHMTPRLDAGPALAVRTTPVRPDETAEALEPRLATLGVDAALVAVTQLEDWDGASQLGLVQDRSLITKAPRFSKSDGQLDFRLSAEYLVRLVRACQPWPGTFAELCWPEGKRLRVIVRLARSVVSADDCIFDSPSMGAVTQVTFEQLTKVDAGSDWSGAWQTMLATQTPEGIFLIGCLQPAGKRAMSAQEFLRGHALKPGCTFVLPKLPCKQLDASRSA